MKGRMVALDTLDDREAAALIVDGALDDLLIDTDLPRAGTIYRAIADRPQKGQGGLFLRTPDGNAFLRRSRGIAPGDAVLVQVTGYAEPGKAIPVTDRILFKSRYAIVTPGAPGINVSRQIRDDDARDAILVAAKTALAEAPLPDGAGLILRSSCVDAGAEDIIDDVAAMAGLAAQVLSDPDTGAETLIEGDGPHMLAWREWVGAAQDAERGSFDRHGVWDAIAALRAPRVALPGGASMMIEATSALVAVDVNTGGDGSPAAGLKANIAAARELPRQLRLRGLSGQVVIDAAPCPKKDRRQVDQALRAALKRDSAETVLVGWTTMGLIELQRQRDRIPLVEALP